MFDFFRGSIDDGYLPDERFGIGNSQDLSRDSIGSPELFQKER
jgi:hypothetical protein